MQYEYGVEYKNNGEKPDLPDDVEVEWAARYSHWVRVDRVGNLEWDKSHPYSVTIEKFRIVDERYKPKEQDMNNDWYEKGELPPVGSVITAIDKRKSSGGIKCELKYMGADVCVLYDIDDDIEFAINLCHVEFKPLNTERDVLVEKAIRTINNSSEDVYYQLSTHLIKLLAEYFIDNDWRPIKPMSEQEFMKQCVDICGHGDARLYRAGCRFIEQVKV